MRRTRSLRHAEDMMYNGAMKRAVAFAAVLLLNLVASRANAQNADPFFFGDEAALGAGAVVASGRDSGALWYNPAGYGDLKRGFVSASATTVGLRVRTIPQALRVRAGTVLRTTDLSSVDLVSVPNAIVAATTLTPKLAIAGGMLVTSRDLRSALATPSDQALSDAVGPLDVAQRLDLQADSAKYHVGGALAAAITDVFRIGGAVFLTYGKQTNNVQYSLNALRGPAPTDEHAFIIAGSRVTSTAIGLAASIGTQYQLSELIALGLTIRSPEIALSASADGGVVLGAASAGGTDPAQAGLTTIPATRGAAAGKLVAPTRVLAGMAFALGPPQSWFEIGVDVAHGLPASPVRDAQQPAINGRAGIRYMLSPSWIVGGGLFTDRVTVARLNQAVASDRVDYYGLTAGISKRTPLALVQDRRPEALVLVTTLSLRSSVGFGEARAVLIDLNDDSGRGTDARSSVTFFEVMPYLGSAVIF